MALPDASTDGGSAPPPVSSSALLHWLHDVRNPLAAMVANLHHVRSSNALAGDEGAGEIVAEVMALCGVLERYVGNLEVLVHPRKARGRPQVHLAEIVADVAKRTANLAALTGHTVEVETRDDPVLAADGAMLRVSLENLVANAVEQSPGGVVRLEVEVRDGLGLVRVVDGGPAWAAADLDPTTALALASPAQRGTTRGGRVGRGLSLAAAAHAALSAGAHLLLLPDATGRPCATLASPLAHLETP